jgi:hypothetical protein
VVEGDEGLRQRRRVATERLGHPGTDPHPAMTRGHVAEHHVGIEEGIG